MLKITVILFDVGPIRDDKSLDKQKWQNFTPLPMHLLWITGRTFGEDLCQTTQIQVANALQKKGVKVTFVSPDNGSTENFVKSEGHGFVPGIKISKILGLKSLSFERCLSKSLPEILSKLQPDIAVCDWRGARGAWKPLEKARIPWSMVDRGPPAYRTILGRLQWLHYDRAWKSAGKRATSCFTVSKAHKEFVQSRFKINKPIIVLPAAADSSTFNLTNSQKKEGKPGFDRPLKIVYHGRLDYSRNVNKLVLVVDQLRYSGIEAELLLFGMGTAERKLRKLSMKFDWLTVHSKQPFSKVPKLLAEMDLGILPMGDQLVWKTASPLKLFEYAASGLPIIATDIAAHRLEGEPEWIGLVTCDQMIEAMVRKIQSWAIDDKIEKLGYLARKELHEKYTWDHAITDALKNLEQMSTTNLDQ